MFARRRKKQREEFLERWEPIAAAHAAQIRRIGVTMEEAIEAMRILGCALAKANRAPAFKEKLTS